MTCRFNVLKKLLAARGLPSGLLILALLTTLITSCNRYVVTVNENPVYKPPALFSDFAIRDPALATCVTETVRALQIVKASQLKVLQCSRMNIETVDGIAIFTQLSTLDLSNNKLVDVTPLFELPGLQKVRLAGNTTLDCNVAKNLEIKFDNVDLPKHCVK